MALQALQAVPDDNQVHTQALARRLQRHHDDNRDCVSACTHTQTQMDALAFFATLASDNACAEVMGPVEGADKISEVLQQPHKQQSAVAYSHVALSHTHNYPLHVQIMNDIAIVTGANPDDEDLQTWARRALPPLSHIYDAQHVRNILSLSHTATDCPPTPPQKMERKQPPRSSSSDSITTATTSSRARSTTAATSVSKPTSTYRASPDRARARAGSTSTAWQENTSVAMSSSSSSSAMRMQSSSVATSLVSTDMASSSRDREALATASRRISELQVHQVASRMATTPQSAAPSVHTGGARACPYRAHSRQGSQASGRGTHCTPWQRRGGAGRAATGS